MKHYTFTASKHELLRAVEDMSYCVFTKPDDDGWVTGYAQGAWVPSDLSAITLGTAPSGVMRSVIHGLGRITTEVGHYITMGRCGSCGAVDASTWSPSECETCFLGLGLKNRNAV